MAKDGDTLKSEIEEGLLELVNDRLTPLQKKIENVIVSVDSLVNGFNEILNPFFHDASSGWFPLLYLNYS